MRISLSLWVRMPRSRCAQATAVQAGNHPIRYLSVGISVAKRTRIRHTYLLKRNFIAHASRRLHIR